MNVALAIARKALVGRLPFAGALRRAKRRRFGYRPDPSNLSSTLENYGRIHAAAQAHGRPVAGARVLEIGTGWFPMLPILMCADGAAEVRMTDLNPHMDERTFDTALRYVQERFPERQRLQAVRHMADLPLHYSAPFAPSMLADGAVDLVVSRTVLEHIEPAPLQALMAALRPKLARGGLMVHLVDHSDHLEHLDLTNRTSPLNFLQWSPALHRAVNGLTRDGENRLRHHQYPPLFEAAGYEVLAAEGEVHPRALQSLAGLRLAPPFDTMTREQLAVLVSLYVLRPR